MRCMACGAEMLLMKVAEDDTMAVSGFEHHTFMCSGCGDVEGRLIFNREQAIPAGSVTIHAAPPLSPATTVSPTTPVQTSPAAPGLLERMTSRFRGWPRS
jgi:hypothetical protein